MCFLAYTYLKITLLGGKMAEIKSYGTKFGFLSGSTLKLIACIAMFIDHFGLMIYPDEIIFRAIGRLAFPIFAYFIAEGCRYTKNKLKHFMLVFGVGIIYLGFYYVFADTLYPSIFLTFSVSILLIYLLEYLKKIALDTPSACKIIAAILVFAAALAVAYIPFHFVTFDYGYIGMLAPVLISIFDFGKVDVPDKARRLDSYALRLVILALMCVLLVMKKHDWCFNVFGISVPMQCCNLLAIPVLCLYNGKAGNKKLKYFFYAFYPLHLGVIMAIYIIIELLK